MKGSIQNHYSLPLHKPKRQSASADLTILFTLVPLLNVIFWKTMSSSLRPVKITACRPTFFRGPSMISVWTVPGEVLRTFLNYNSCYERRSSVHERAVCCTLANTCMTLARPGQQILPVFSGLRRFLHPHLLNHRVHDSTLR